MSKEILFLMIAGLMLQACEKTVYFDVDTQENKLVVNTFVQPDSEVVATVSLSADPLEIGFEGIKVNDAGISIYKNDVLAGAFDFISDGVYKMDGSTLEAAPGDALRLEVIAPGRESVTASTVIPDLVPIEEVKIIDTIMVTVSYSAFDSLGNYYELDTVVPHYELQITFTDPPGEDHYSLTINYEDMYSETYTCFSTDDPAFTVDGDFNFGSADENGTVTICDEAFFNDLTFEGKQKTIIVNLLEIPTEFLTDPKFVFRLNHLSEDYYSFLVTSTTQQSNGDNPFSEPAIVFSNILHGFGIFAGFCSSTAEIDL